MFGIRKPSSSRLKAEIPHYSEFGITWFPFFGEPHPFNSYRFSETTNPNYDPHDFHSKFDPENDLLFFILDLYKFVKSYKEGITKSQLSKTLNVVLPPDWNVRSSAVNVLNRIMKTKYTLDLRARDYDRFKNSFDFYNYFNEYSRVQKKYLETPYGKLDTWLMSVHPDVRQQLMLKYAGHFTVGGYPIYDPKTQQAEYKALTQTLEAAALQIHRNMRGTTKRSTSISSSNPSTPTKRDPSTSLPITASPGAKPDTINETETLSVDDYENFDSNLTMVTSDDPEAAAEFVRKFPTRPCQVLSIDYVPGFPDDQGYDMLFIVQDRFTKGIFLAPCSRPDTPEQFWNTFSDLVLARAGGYPEQVVSSGRRSKFKGFFEDKCKEHNIKHLRTSTFKPQIGGGLQQAKKRITKFLKEQPSNKGKYAYWVDLLIECESDYNSHNNPISGVSPYFCMYGSQLLTKVPEVIGEERFAKVKTKLERSLKANTNETLEATWKRVFYRLKAHADSATAAYQRQNADEDESGDENNGGNRRRSKRQSIGKSASKETLKEDKSENSTLNNSSGNNSADERAPKDNNKENEHNDDDDDDNNSNKTKTSVASSVQNSPFKKHIRSFLTDEAPASPTAPLEPKTINRNSVISEAVRKLNATSLEDKVQIQV